MRWGRRARFRIEAEEVVSEAEWLLAGKTAVGYAVCGRQAPGWSLVGVLAHRPQVELVQLAAVPVAPDRPWTAAMVRLATEVLAVAASDDDLLAVQRDVLTPLELELLSGAAVEPPTPDDFVDLILDALDARRRAY